MTEAARNIYQAWLDETAGLIMAGDLERLSDYFTLPYLLRSPGSRLIIETRKDMMDGHRSYGDVLKAHGVNQLIRLVSEAEFLSPKYIEGHHVIHCLKNATPAIPSFGSSIVLRRVGDAWKLAESATKMKLSSWPLQIVQVDPEFSLETRQEDDARREAAEPLSLYQTFLNRLTQAQVRDDLDGYCALCDFPYSTHFGETDVIVKSPADVVNFFDSARQLLREHRIEAFMRIADRAEFLSGSEICGYHKARFVRDGRDVLDPIRSRMILRRKNTQWYLKSVTNALKDTPYPYSKIIPSELLPTQLQIQERTKTWPSL